MARVTEQTPFAMQDEDVLWFGGAAARQGSRNNFAGTAGDDLLVGTHIGDNFDVSQGGDDFVRGGGGDDKFFFGETYTDADVVYGGNGYDRMVLDGTSETTMTLGPDNFRGVESIKLTSGTYDITLVDGIADLKVRVFNGSSNIDLDASQLKSASVSVFGGVNGDRLIGGALSDHIIGGFGGDVITGGLGRDTFKYTSPLESTEKFSQNPDEITDFEKGDKIILPPIDGEMRGYHIGSTASHVGDVVASFDEASQQTVVNVFMDNDDVPDMTFLLTGSFTGFEVHHQANLVTI